MTGDDHRHARSDPASSSKPLQSEKTVGELFDEVATDVGILLSTQIDLAKLELREEAVHASRAARSLGAAAVVGAIAVLMMSVAAAWAIGDLLGARAAGFMVVGGIESLVATVLLLRGRVRLRRSGPLTDTR